MKQKAVIILFMVVIVVGYYYYSANQKKVYEEEIKFYKDIINSETQWINSLQLSNGAFAFRVKEGELAWINPYFADYSAMALLKQDNNQYYSEVKEYLDWHLAHLNTSDSDINNLDGTIYEYYAETNGKKVLFETTKQMYDSVDSYAASFLDLLKEYYYFTEDDAYLINNYKDIVRIINALKKTIDKNNLTFAKPDYTFIFLMDNSEVFEGLTSAIDLYEKVFLPTFRTDKNQYDKVVSDYNSLRVIKNNLITSFENELWDDSKLNYIVALNDNRKQQTEFSWKRFYPDATSQLFPIIHGVIKNKHKRSKYLYDRFCSQFSWQNFEHYNYGNADFYWARIAYAAAVLKDEISVKNYMEHYKENVIEEHSKPLYNAEAAWVVLTADKMINLYENKMKWLM